MQNLIISICESELFDDMMSSKRDMIFGIWVRFASLLQKIIYFNTDDKKL